MTERLTYRASANRSGDRWAITIHDLPDGMIGTTQAHDKDSAYTMTRHVIAMLLCADEDSFDIDITFRE